MTENGMLKDLSGLPLRKALCEALGWTVQERLGSAGDCRYSVVLAPDGGVWAAPVFSDLAGYPEECWKFAPAYESDATLSEELLDRECRRRKLRWELYQSALGPPDSYYCSIHSASEIVIAEGWGETPSEARARALLRAIHVELCAHHADLEQRLQEAERLLRRVSELSLNIVNLEKRLPSLKSDIEKWL